MKNFTTAVVDLSCTEIQMKDFNRVLCSFMMTVSMNCFTQLTNQSAVSSSNASFQLRAAGSAVVRGHLPHHFLKYCGDTPLLLEFRIRPKKPSVLPKLHKQAE